MPASLHALRGLVALMRLPGRSPRTGSLGIMLGGMGTMLPAERRGGLAAQGMKSVFAAPLATCATAAIVGTLI